ncbi:30S ribosomal protein S8 [Candidatus Peregrinibacteria bacterium]|nr:30S ribosomal protein S8 [Candidatus Peregrinibacteria bacterium]
MYTDPIADMLTRIRNAIMAHHETVTVPYSKIKEEILRIMKANKFINEYADEAEGSHKLLRITLNEERVGLTLTRVSKPGQRIYLKKDKLKPLKSGLGIRILSTSKGLMTNSEAKKQNIGGELICEIS